MKREWDALCTSQAQFIEYVNNNLKQSNRIIFYNHIGHFGSEYALSSRFNKARILSFSQLKHKTGKNILFRLLNIVAAIVTFILNETKKGDVRTTISTILSNMENIYLGIDKEKEYLKYLHLKKFSRKNGKIRFIIRIDENDIELDEDVQCLKLLCRLIENGKINTTMLLIHGEYLNLLNLENQNSSKNIPLFQLQEGDLCFIAKQNNLEITKVIFDNIDLIKKLGLQFFLDNYNYFGALAEIQEVKFDWIKRMDWIISQIIKKSELTDNQIYPLLEFSSFFEKNFSKIEIQNFKENQLDAENLNIAYKLAIISQEKSSHYIVPTYSFKLEAFKLYFATKYCSDLKPMPKYIFQYFRENYPFKYTSALKVLQVDSSFVEYKEKQSLLIIGYYYENNEKGSFKNNDFIRLTTKGSTVSTIIRLYEYFKNRVQDDDLNINIASAIKGLKNNSLDAIATCAGYVMVLQFLKENYIQFPDISFSTIIREFMAAILNIEVNDNYSKYWLVHFKCQYIALSLEDENENGRTARRFLDNIKKVREEENFSAYIAGNQLRGFTRIDLLAFSLAYDNAGEILQNLYIESEESTILKELARINYSAYLIENESYHEAEKILQKGNPAFLKNINNDTYYGYLNNLYLAQLGNNIIDIKTYISLMEALIHNDISYSDKLIIENNLSVAYLKDNVYVDKGEKILIEILEKGNPYNRFLAIHNLISFYFTQNDVIKFNDIYSKIFIPKLLLSDKTFFLNKFRWMKENIGQTTFKDFKHNSHVITCYNELYLMSSIERWFE